MFRQARCRLLQGVVTSSLRTDLLNLLAPIKRNEARNKYRDVKDAGYRLHRRPDPGEGLERNDGAIPESRQGHIAVVEEVCPCRLSGWRGPGERPRGDLFDDPVGQRPGDPKKQLDRDAAAVDDRPRSDLGCAPTRDRRGDGKRT